MLGPFKPTLFYKTHLETDMTNLAMDPLTLGHVAITLIGLVAGLVVLAAMIGGRELKGWTAVFLLFTVLTSVTGYFFHNDHLTPGQIVGAISLVVLAAALYAFYGRQLAGIWRPVYVVTATLALYLNFFVLVVQLFLKVPPLHALAPTGGGPVFGAAQGVVFLAFVVAGWRAVRDFRPSAL
jgi:hypothetical protein